MERLRDKKGKLLNPPPIEQEGPDSWVMFYDLSFLAILGGLGFGIYKLIAWGLK